VSPSGLHTFLVPNDELILNHITVDRAALQAPVEVTARACPDMPETQRGSAQPAASMHANSSSRQAAGSAAE